MEALATIARAVAVHDPDRAARLAATAETTAHAMSEPDQRAWALAVVAEAAAAHDPARASRLVGRAFADGSWLVPLSVLATFQPQTVMQILDELGE